MARRIVAILNPISGRRNMLPMVKQVGQVLERQGSTLDIRVTERAGHATAIAAELSADVDAVLVVGGDGAVGEVINGLVGRLVPVTIMRTGTENLLANEFGMPARPSAVARTLLDGDTFDCDVGVLNDRHFIAVAGVGFDAECMDRMARTRRGHITYGDYFWPTWRTFWGHRFPRLRVTADDQCVFEGRGLALIGVIGRYAAHLRVLCNARHDDGLLDLCVLECSSRTRLVRHALRMLLRRHVGSNGVVYRQCRRINISSPDDALIEVDGELGGRLPAKCSVLPRAVRFLRPPRTLGGYAATPALRLQG